MLAGRSARDQTLRNPTAKEKCFSIDSALVVERCNRKVPNSVEVLRVNSVVQSKTLY